MTKEMTNIMSDETYVRAEVLADVRSESKYGHEIWTAYGITEDNRYIPLTSCDSFDAGVLWLQENYPDLQGIVW